MDTMQGWVPGGIHSFLPPQFGVGNRAVLRLFERLQDPVPAEEDALPELHGGEEAAAREVERLAAAREAKPLGEAVGVHHRRDLRLVEAREVRRPRTAAVTSHRG